jgi:hypothetical protein
MFAFIRDVLNPICPCKSGKRWNQCCGRHSEVQPGILSRVGRALKSQSKPVPMREAKRKSA